MTDNQETLARLFQHIETADIILENKKLDAHNLRIQMFNILDSIERTALKLVIKQPNTLTDTSPFMSHVCTCVCGCNNTTNPRTYDLCWICSQADAKFHHTREGVLIG